MDAKTLRAALTDLAKQERQTRAEFLRLLAELDGDRHYLELGFASTIAFLTGELRLSKASAYRRVAAARLIRRMPGVLPWLRDGRLTLTKLALLKDVLSEENHADVLARAAALPEHEVAALALRLANRETPPPPRDSTGRSRWQSRSLGRSPVPVLKPPPCQLSRTKSR